MAKREKGVRKLTRVGRYGYYVVIPPEIIRELKWKERQKLIVKRVGKKVVAQDWKK